MRILGVRSPPVSDWVIVVVNSIFFFFYIYIYIFLSHCLPLAAVIRTILISNVVYNAFNKVTNKVTIIVMVFSFLIKLNR